MKIIYYLDIRVYSKIKNKKYKDKMHKYPQIFHVCLIFSLNFFLGIRCIIFFNLYLSCLKGHNQVKNFDIYEVFNDV